MSRKDYELIADALAKAFLSVDDMTGLTSEHVVARQCGVVRAMCYVAQGLAADNERFQGSRFYDAFWTKVGL